MGDPNLETAGAEDLGPDREWEWTDLPRLGKRVKVRYAATSEIAYLSLLPDMVDFAEAARELQEDVEADRKPKPDVDSFASASFTGENARWRERLAHMVVQHPDSGGELKPCEECPKFQHPRSLWSARQTKRLHGDDLMAISERTLSPRTFERVRPFSEGQTEPASPEPVATTG